MARIEMHAAPPGASLAALGVQSPRLASAIVDTIAKTLEYTFVPDFPLENNEIHIHGFVPPGWRTDAIVKLSNRSRDGVWNYEEWQEKNILAGLSYFSVTLPDGTSIRSQIEQTDQPTATFENYVTLTGLAGSCTTRITIPGMVENVPMEMEPAQVMMARTAAISAADGRREQTIGCAVRVGGAQVPGIGRIEIQMYKDENPGHIISMNAGSDFPARMTLDVRKRYVTPHGTFYSEREEFEANNIERFPPFGVRFTPVKPTADLKNEATGEVVGHIDLGWLVPLCYLDTANFPPKAFPIPEEE